MCRFEVSLVSQKLLNIFLSTGLKFFCSNVHAEIPVYDVLGLARWEIPNFRGTKITNLVSKFYTLKIEHHTES